MRRHLRRLLVGLLVLGGALIIVGLFVGVVLFCAWAAYRGVWWPAGIGAAVLVLGLAYCLGSDEGAD